MREVDTWPLDRVYNYLRRSVCVYYLYAVIFVILAAIAFDRGDSTFGGLYMGQIALVLLRNGTSLWDFKQRTVQSGYVAAVFSVMFPLYIVATLIYEITFGQLVYSIVITFILAALYIISSVLSVYIYIRVIKRLQAGEDPRKANTPATATPVVPPFVVTEGATQGA